MLVTWYILGGTPYTHVYPISRFWCFWTYQCDTHRCPETYHTYQFGTSWSFREISPIHVHVGQLRQTWEVSKVTFKPTISHHKKCIIRKYIEIWTRAFAFHFETLFHLLPSLNDENEWTWCWSLSHVLHLSLMLSWSKCTRHQNVSLNLLIAGFSTKICECQPKPADGSSLRPLPPTVRVMCCKMT